MQQLCDPQFLPERHDPGPCAGALVQFQAQDPATGDSVEWRLCAGHRDQYLRCRRCQNRLVSPYMVRGLCTECVYLLRDSGTE